MILAFAAHVSSFLFFWQELNHEMLYIYIYIYIYISLLLRLRKAAICCLKVLFYKKNSKGNFLRKKSKIIKKSIIIENVFRFEDNLKQ